MNIKTTRPNNIKKVKEIINSLPQERKDLINEGKYEEVLRFGPFGGWAFYGIYWQSIFEADPNYFKTIDFIPDGFYAYMEGQSSWDFGDYPNLKVIGYNSFYKSDLHKISLPSSVEEIKNRAFADLKYDSLTIYYKGTKKQFKNIKKENEWRGTKKYNGYSTSVVVHCIDGELYY